MHQISSKFWPVLTKGLYSDTLATWEEVLYNKSTSVCVYVCVFVQLWANALCYCLCEGSGRLSDSPGCSVYPELMTELTMMTLTFFLVTAKTLFYCSTIWNQCQTAPCFWHKRQSLFGTPGGPRHVYSHAKLFKPTLKYPPNKPSVHFLTALAVWWKRAAC